jgi:hypothetical protein
MSAGNNRINLVAAATSRRFRGNTLGALLWRGFQSGAELRPAGEPTNQFFI